MGPITEFVTDLPVDQFKTLYKLVAGENIGKRTVALAASNIILYGEGLLLPELDAPIAYGWAEAGQGVFASEAPPTREELKEMLAPFGAPDEGAPVPMAMDRERLVKLIKMIFTILPGILAI